LIPPFAPARVVQILFATGSVDTGRLEMSVRVPADLHLGPGRGDREHADPAEDLLGIDAAAAAIGVLEAGATPSPRDARLRTVNVFEPCHGRLLSPSAELAISLVLWLRSR
jgi:hypothetical protein